MGDRVYNIHGVPSASKVSGCIKGTQFWYISGLQIKKKDKHNGKLKTDQEAIALKRKKKKTHPKTSKFFIALATSVNVFLILSLHTQALQGTWSWNCTLTQEPFLGWERNFRLVALPAQWGKEGNFHWGGNFHTPGRMILQAMFK